MKTAENFIDNLGISYTTTISDDKKLPYLKEELVTNVVMEIMKEQIRAGYVLTIQAENSAMEDSLIVEFKNGWAFLYIVKATKEHYEYFTFLNQEYREDMTPMNISMNGSVPKKNACDNINVIIEIIETFCRTGEIYHNCSWEHEEH